MATMAAMTAAAATLGLPQLAPPATAAAAKPHCPSAQFGAAVAISGNTAVIGSPTAPGGGAVCVFARSSGTWHLQAVLRDPPHGRYDGFGSVVAVSGTAAGTYAMIGTTQSDGPVYVFALSGGSWRHTQTMRDPAGYHPGDLFGSALAISGTSAVITAFGSSNNKGAVYMYALTGRSWRLSTALKNPGILNFGGLAAMSGATVIIGDGARSSPPGALQSQPCRPGSPAHTDTNMYPDAYVFTRSGSRWRLQAHLVAHSSDNSEPSAVVSGNLVLVGGFLTGCGASNKLDHGHVYAFRRTGNSWHQLAVIDDPGRSRGDFSIGLAVSGANAVVGAPYAFKNCGTAYVFHWTSRRWVLTTKLVPPGAGICKKFPAFGWAIALSGKTAIIGAPGNGMTYVQNIR